MPVNTVKLTGDQVFSGTHTSGQKIYFRSDTAGDDGNILIFGKKTSDSNADAEQVAVGTNEGKIEHLANAELSDVFLVKYPSALAGNGSFFSNDGTQASGGITIVSRPATGDTIEIGLNGFTKTFTFQQTTVSANGHVYSDSDLNKTAANLASAINDASTGSPTAGEGSGGTYGWYNTDNPNPYLTATVSGTTVTVTDKIKCERQLSWVTTVSNASSLSICPIRGGIDGTKIVTVSASNSSASKTISSGIDLDSEDLSATNVDGYLSNTAFDSVATRGRFVVDIYCQDPGASVTPVIQLSNDNTNWRDATSTITDLNTDQQQHISGNDLFAEYARIKFTTWSLTNPKSFNIKIISQA